MQEAWIAGCGPEEWNRSLPVEPRQQLATGQPEAPDNQNDRECMRNAEPPFPRGQGTPDSGDRHGRRSDQVEHELEAARVRVRPHEHPDTQRETETDPHPRRNPGAPASWAGVQRSRRTDAGDARTGRDRHGRHAAAERRLALRQLREEPVHLTHLAIPVALFLILLLLLHWTPPSPPRDRPYRSIFL